MTKKEEIISKLVTFFNNVPKNKWFTYGFIARECGLHFTTLQSNLEEQKQWEGLNLKFLETPNGTLVAIAENEYTIIMKKLEILEKRMEELLNLFKK